MSGVNARIVIYAALLLTFGIYPRPSLAAADVITIPEGTPVVAALELLRSRGLAVLFSDRLITTELRLRSGVSADNPREAAQRLLAEHGLQLRALRPGLFVIVRSAPERPEAAESLQDSAPLAEIAIYASRYSVDAPTTSAFQLQRSEIETLAALNDDTLRVAQTLPGTASTPLGAKTHVRGGLDNEMLVRFDGIPQLDPFHFKDYGAILGSIEPTTVESLDFYSGVFPVRHGDRLSAVMDIQPRRASGENHHEIGLSLLALHALSVGEAQVAGAETRWLMSGRSSSAGWVARAAGIDDTEVEFSDLLLRGERVVSDWTLVAGLSILQDELDYRDDDPLTGRELTSAGYRDNMAWIKGRRDTAPGRRMEIALARVDSKADRRGEWADDPIVEGLVSEDRRTNGYYFDIAWKQAGSWTVGAEILTLKSHYDHTIRARYDPALAALFARTPLLARESLIDARTQTISGYASKLFTLSSRWRIDLGVRGDHRTLPNDRLDWSPRLAMEYELAEGRFLRVSGGRNSQSQRAHELHVADGEPLLYTIQKADQWIIGYEQLLADHGAWRIETYRKRISDPSPRYENLLNPLSLIPEMEIDRRRIAPDSALAYGVEFAGRYRLDDQWSGFLNYTWSEVEDHFGLIDVPRNWNQQHALLLGLLWRSGPWSVSAQGSWHTGWSRTEFSTGESGKLVPLLGERNRARWPAAWNIDLRASWRKPLSIGVMDVHFDVKNLTNRSNLCCTDLRVVGGQLDARTRSWLPRYVNLGLVWSVP